jgi:hypothetical protein
MIRLPGNMKYNTDPKIRAAVDNILKQCATIFANLGTNTKHDLKTVEAAKAEERRLIDTIKDIDKDFYHDKLFIPREEEKEDY